MGIILLYLQSIDFLRTAKNLSFNRDAIGCCKTIILISRAIP